MDEREHPVALALVELGISNRRYAKQTDTAGIVTFLVESNTMRTSLSVRIVGYQPLVDSVTWRDSPDTVVVRLASIAERLAEVTVRERAPAVARLAAVDQRIANGTPSAAVTRADIEKRNPIALSRMLRGIPGLRLADSSGATVAISTRGNKMVRLQPVPCVMRISIDGIVLSASADIDQTPPVNVHAIEVYFGGARIPPEFGGIRTDAWCGLISIWTR